VAGHRMSTGQLEEVVAHNSAVAECAVVGVQDSLKVCLFFSPFSTSLFS
jgi:propionyl-CoA synthetase